MGETFLIDGPPGCGKTTYLAHQAERAAGIHGPERVVIASLTRTAAAEIAGRDHGIPEANIGTLHAHCWRGLDRPALAETPEGLKLWNAEHPAATLTGGSGHTALEDAPDADPGATSRTRADELHSAITIHRARRVPIEQWTEEERDHFELWKQFKDKTGRLDFTDLIDAAHEAGAHFAHPRVILADEAQDFSRLELRLVVAWAQHAETTVIVGDTRQALYQWRGSDPETLLHLRAAERRTLGQSYRVPRAAHAAAQRWVSALDEGPADYAPTDVEGTTRHLPIALTDAESLVDRLEAALVNQPEDTMMVLASCGYMLGPLLGELRERGIPFHNPYRVKQGAWNPMRAAARLRAFLRADERVWGDQARAWTWADLWSWVEPLKQRDCLPRGVKSHVEDKLRPDRFKQRPYADREVPTETLCELFECTLHHPMFHGDAQWWFDNLLAGPRKTMAYPMRVLRRQGPAALGETPRVIVGTIHSVKGGQADHVYISPGLSKQGYWHGWTAGGAPRDQIIRMFYVALTRARRSITILDPGPEDHILGALLDAIGQAPAPQRPMQGQVIDLEARLQERLRRAA